MGRQVLHRIGGASVGNLRLRPVDAALDPPGISVLESPSPAEAAAEMRAALPRATGLVRAAQTVGSATADSIRAAGFDLIAVPTRRLPGHHRLIHPEGAAAFTDENLARLAGAFTTTAGH